jgi:NADH-quinone oxidoreductase subunit I
MFGKGLLKGLSVTGKEAVSKRMTEKYPEEMPYLAACYRGGNFQLQAENCIGCGLCAKACPNKAIEVVTEKNEEGKRQVTAYWIDRQYCLFCGFCVDACNKDALHFTLDFETAVYSRFEVPVNLLDNPNLDRAASVYGVKPPKAAVKKPAVKSDEAKSAGEKEEKETPAVTEEKGVE